MLYLFDKCSSFLFVAVCLFVWFVVSIHGCCSHNLSFANAVAGLRVRIFILFEIMALCLLNMVFCPGSELPLPSLSLDLDMCLPASPVCLIVSQPCVIVCLFIFKIFHRADLG